MLILGTGSVGVVRAGLEIHLPLWWNIIIVFFDLEHRHGGPKPCNEGPDLFHACVDFCVRVESTEAETERGFGESFWHAQRAEHMRRLAGT